LVAVEDAVTSSVGDLGTVDGHDGVREMNIFDFTDQPDHAFEWIKSIPKVARNLKKMKAGCRAAGEDEYTPIYPEGLKHFSVI
jgi:hypothetical protein